VLRQDVRYGLRNLRRSAGFTAVAIARLAIGIGANTAVFSIVDGVLFKALPYPHPDSFVMFESAPVARQGSSLHQISRRCDIMRRRSRIWPPTET
jgi:hypothetical protein